MKTFLFLCSSILLCSGYVHANESDFNSSLLFENENRIALSDGSVGSGGSGGSGGWYLAPHVGYNIISNTSTQGMNIKFENGLSLGLGLGFEMQTDLAFQFDFGYIRNDVDTITNETTSVGSAPNIEFTQIPLIANFIWSPSRQPDLKPYFLLGAGAIRGKYDSNTFIDSGADWALAIRAGVGAKVDLSTSSSLSIGYEFTLAQYDDAIDNHTLRLGLSFTF